MSDEITNKYIGIDYNEIPNLLASIIDTKAVTINIIETNDFKNVANMPARVKCATLGIDGIYDMQEEKTYRIEQIVDLLNEQQATINILLEELVNAQQQGYVIGFLY